MKKFGKMCLVAVVLALGNCKPYDPFELLTGEITVQEALGYKSDAPYMAVAAESKHYKIAGTYFPRLYDGMNYGASGNEDGALNPGETVIYELVVANYGKKSALSVSAVISTDDKYVSNMTNTKGDIGYFKECDRYSPDFKTIFSGTNKEKNLRFTVSSDAPPNHLIKFEIFFSDAYDNTWRDYFLLTVY